MRKLYTTSIFLFFFGLFSSWNSFGQTVSISNTQTFEGGNVVFTVSLSGASASDTVITLTTSNGTASLSDYTSIALTVIIPAGQTSMTVSLPTVDDIFSCESTETFTLNGIVTSGNTSNTTAFGTCFINDNEGAPSVVISNVTVTEGTNAVFTIMLSNPCAFDTVIDLVTTNGTAVTPGDYTAFFATVTIPAGTTSTTVTIPTIADVLTVTEPTETFTLNGVVTSTNTSNTTASGTCTIIEQLSQSGINAVTEITPSISGYTGGATAPLTTNDTLNGNPVIVGTAPGNVTITVGAIQGGLSMNPSTGVVIVPPNTPAGSYNVIYTICEVSNPSNCDTVTSVIEVSAATIDAVADMLTVLSGTTTSSLIANDTLNGNPAVIGLNPGDVTLTSTPTVQFSINPTTGVITVSPNTPAGNYPITYTICEVTNPTNCDTVTSIVNVTSNLGITLTGSYSDYNNDGFTNVGDVINYQVTVSNSGSQPITNINYAQGNATINGGPIASLAGGATDTTTFTGVYVLTQNNINSGVVSIDACFYADNSISQCGTTTTTLNLSNGIRLNAFLDSNSNGIQNSGEPNIGIGNFNYTINGGAINNVISSNGVLYLYESNPTTIYNLSYVISGNYSCSTTYSNVTVAAGSGITTYNFPVTVTPYTDLAVNIYPWSPPRPGFTYTTQIYYRNNGNQTIASGTITYTKDNALTITSVSPLSTTTTATGFTYNFTNLLPNEFRTINVTHSVPTIPTVSLGQMVTSSVAASIPVGDVNTSNNTSSFSQPIVGSYDPNDKSESHGGKILHSTFTSNDYLTYTINFENTGTAEAINIRVNDILDAKLDETSIKMVTASSGYTLQRVGSTLTWKFDGINLPPSNGSATVGHGQIVFQIKPKAGYAVGDIIPNIANIYFDFNPAIVTNVCNTEFVNSLSNPNFTFNDFKVYPNPTKNNLTISNEFAINEVEISSILGQKMITKKVNDLQTTIDTSELSAGIYFVKVSSQGNEKTVKIVKE